MPWESTLDHRISIVNVRVWLYACAVDLEPNLEPIQAGSVVEIAYQRIRRMIVDGTLPSDRRLNQGQLAASFGISTTSVREALHRLVADALVDFRRNRGFFVAAPLQMDTVINRLEVRLLLEPGIARLAAERRTGEQVRELREVIQGEANAESLDQAHDLSRTFHLTVARAAHNPELTRTLESLWIPDVGRQLLARRLLESDTWQAEDVSEHTNIADAVASGDEEGAAQLMLEHLNAAYRHWTAERTDDNDAASPPALASS